MIPTDINPGGVITGWYCTADCYPPAGTIAGFLRVPDGALTTFDAPPGGYLSGTIYMIAPPPSINPAGEIAGTYYDGSGAHGFLRARDGTLTTIDVPGAYYGSTEVFDINPAGVIVGDFCSPSTCYHGFLRTSDGTFSDINANAGIAVAINPAGAITGGALDGSGGYLRSPDGGFTTFNPPGSQYTSPSAINPAGAITGLYCEAIPVGCHGFLRNQEGKITTFDPPGSTFTWPTAINPAGVVTGVFDDASGFEHGFVYRP
jgi:hypothetical protein